MGGLASPELHAIAILFTRDCAERERCQSEHRDLIARCEGVELLSSLDLDATPPFDYAHDHFGYRDRLSQPIIEGSGDEPTPGSGGPLKAGELILGYPDEDGYVASRPEPEVLRRNGSYAAYRRLEEHVGAFRDFLREHGQTREEQELIAAKLMGAGEAEPPRAGTGQGRSCPRGRSAAEQRLQLQGFGPSRVRRAAGIAHAPHEPARHGREYNRRRMIRRGATYGPHLPEDAPEDGKERGIAAFVICGSLIRQFELRKTYGPMTRTSMNSPMNAIRSSATRTARWNSRSPSGRSGRKSRGCRHSRPFEEERTLLPGLSALRYLATLSDGRPNQH